MTNPQPADSNPLERLAERLRQGGPFAVITGAGLSTASGIPAYRDHKGHWQHRQPIQHQAFLQSDTVRRRYWARSFVGWPTVSQAQPNDGHRALASLAQSGFISALITQNVDGLHQKACSADVVELHGGIGQVCCLHCHTRFARSAMQDWLTQANPHFDQDAARQAQTAPDGDAHLEDACYTHFRVPACPQCVGILKPDVVFFGDNVPRDRVALSTEKITQSHGLLVVGTSLMVYSGYRFAELAYRQGKPVLAINQGVTRADALLSIKVEQDCATALTALRALLRSLQQSD